MCLVTAQLVGMNLFELCRRKCMMYDCVMSVDVDTKRTRPMKFAQLM